ncbi:MAG TPA: aminotransferase class III-fold pyridoxal phosphate-dependent enzyme, partial [Gammaproteobacteria bacterium]|nr:aminotransferase class III-fold pyridoxal phosphate-dependent enzyme [Gammaproteobacteria bacterium]
MNNHDLLQRDLSVLWHPCTQMKDHEHFLPMIPIQSGKGVWLTDFDGNRYLDAISSWWVNLFGHANPTINTALKAQVDQLEHVLLAGFSHEPVIQLAEKLVERTPQGLDRCFFVDNGSSAIEASLKMSYHYWLNKDKQKKTKFITLSNSYHGETLGALAVGDVELYKSTYKPLLMETITVPSPDCFQRAPDMSWQQHSELMFEHMEQTLKRHAEHACAVIVEPLVQCAG